MRATARIAIALAPVVAVMAACGPTESKEKTTMTPDEARTRLSADIVQVLEAGVPGGAPDVDSSGLNDGIPCGGLEGNEFNKIMHGITVFIPKRSAEPEAAVRRMLAKLTELGYRNGVEPDDGYQAITFSDPFGGGIIQVFSTGRIEVDAETECLDNPDR